MNNEEELLTERGRRAVEVLLAQGYTKEELGELLEILSMAKLQEKRNDEG